MPGTPPHDYGLHPHEDALIRALILPGTRERFLRRTGNPRTREKMFVELAHFYDLDPRFAHRVPGDVDLTYHLLKEKGAPETCHVMGVSHLDGQEVDLREALIDVVLNQWGAFISCIPGRLGYFCGENPGDQFLLER